MKKIAATVFSNHKNQLSVALYQLVHQVMPFGTPLVHDPFFAAELLTTGNAHYIDGYSSDITIPSWKTFLKFANQNIFFSVKEQIVASIEEGKIYWQIFGELQSTICISDLPLISVQIKNHDKMKSFSGHHCVQSFENGILQFKPPTGKIQLLFWTVQCDQSNPPINGNFTITNSENEKEIGISLQLKQSEYFNNHNISVSFPNRGALVKGRDFQKNHVGGVRLLKSQATIQFSIEKTNLEGGVDGFLEFEKAYDGNEREKATISFSEKGKSLSGIEIDADSVTIESAPSDVEIKSSSAFICELKKYVIFATKK